MNRSQFVTSSSLGLFLLATTFAMLDWSSIATGSKFELSFFLRRLPFAVSPFDVVISLLFLAIFYCMFKVAICDLEAIVNFQETKIRCVYC